MALELTLHNRRVLLIISGGVAAYKSLDLIRRLRERGAHVRPILTAAAAQFVTPLSVGALANERVYQDLFDLDAEHEIGHIRLARDTDLVVVAPATADLLAKMAYGLGGDLATACLLATDKPVLVAPAMNPHMWASKATARAVDQLRRDGVAFLGPMAGEMAERGEAGVGRMAESMDIVGAIERLLAPAGGRPLSGKRALVTSGPTHEPLDPVRYIANRSSGRQGHAVAGALAALGAEVTLISGPVSIADPIGCRVVRVETAQQMLEATLATLPVDLAVMAAAVADWRAADEANEKIKKDRSGQPPMMRLVENPDILATIGRHPQLRPRLVVGFAAETEQVIANATSKLQRKGADMIVANDVSPETGVMGGLRNTVRLVTASGVEDWPELAKEDVARRLAERFAALLQPKPPVA